MYRLLLSDGISFSLTVEPLGAPTHRSSRHQLQDTMNCFNGGELGEVCCCSTDFCNSSDSSIRWLAILATIVLLFG
ncbi:unnamed protein product [Haemonchus placei]|uniref:Activin_recp domain-containing protein n=1 Tax=Haemonchus placei TaxID=6290 RepID=A0A0N4XB92_HAEPC|nr:unnamed protein product [Haemonchus placei]